MKKRLTKITTRTGDDGTTGLADGQRTRKTDPRIVAMGCLDELNSALGLLRAVDTGQRIDQQLETVQQRLFDLGGELALPGTALLDDAAILALEQAVTEHNAALPPLQEFVLPGGNEAAARCHLARAICRRAETTLWCLADHTTLNLVAPRYLNRLSDLLFVFARVLARRDGGSEVTWQRDD